VRLISDSFTTISIHGNHSLAKESSLWMPGEGLWTSALTAKSPPKQTQGLKKSRFRDVNNSHFHRHTSSRLIEHNRSVRWVNLCTPPCTEVHYMYVFFRIL
jgi:hypothetical protein